MVLILFVMQECLAVEQRFLALHMVFVRDATVHWANRSTLRLVVETFTFGAFSRHDIIDVVGYWCMRCIGVGFGTVGQDYFPFEFGSVLITPVVCAFVNGGVRTFGLAGAAVDTFVGDDDSHNFLESKLKVESRKSKEKKEKRKEVAIRSSLSTLPF